VFGLLLLAFLVIPIVELYVIVQVASGIGVLDTLALLVLVSIVGAWLVRHQGLSIVGRIQQQLAAGRMPGDELIDGGLVLFAGALMLTPGFVTDAIGLLLLLPPTRLPIRGLLKRRFTGRVTAFTAGSWPGPHRTGPSGSVVDVDGREEQNPDDPEGLREWRP
jgi:UPF0716 protein FxsA